MEIGAIGVDESPAGPPVDDVLDREGELVLDGEADFRARQWDSLPHGFVE